MVDTVSTISTKVPEDKKVLVAICYVFSLLGGIVLLLVGGEDKAIKFHAMQAIVLGVIAIVANITICGGFLVVLYCIYGAYILYTTGDFQAPYVADFVNKNLMK